MKVINDLLDYNGLKIVQNTDWFSFSLDSVLLPNFVTINKNTNKILDLGTGNAPIPMILSTKCDAKIYGVEIQKDVYELACESIKINKLEDKIELINDDMKNLSNYFEINSFDIILCNPPFFKKSEKSKINNDEHKIIARHEVNITLEEVIQIASKYLKNSGVFAMVHRTDRLIEIIEILKKYNMEPKKIQLIYPHEKSDSNIMLIEARKNGNTGLKVLPPIYAHLENGDYTEYIKNLFKAGD